MPGSRPVKSDAWDGSVRGTCDQALSKRTESFRSASSAGVCDLGVAVHRQPVRPEGVDRDQDDGRVREAEVGGRGLPPAARGGRREGDQAGEEREATGDRGSHVGREDSVQRPERLQTRWRVEVPRLQEQKRALAGEGQGRKNPGRKTRSGCPWKSSRYAAAGSWRSVVGLPKFDALLPVRAQRLALGRRSRLRALDRGRGEGVEADEAGVFGGRARADADRRVDGGDALLVEDVQDLRQDEDLDRPDLSRSS